MSRPCSVCGVAIEYSARRIVDAASALYHECDIETVKARLRTPPMTERAIALERGARPEPPPEPTPQRKQPPPTAAPRTAPVYDRPEYRDEL